MRIPDALLDQIRSALTLSTVVGKHIQLKKEGREWKGLSPFNKEKTPSFCVNDNKAAWFDFSSGKNGNVFDFLMQITGCSFIEAVQQCAQLACISLPGSSTKSGSNKSSKKASDAASHSSNGSSAPLNAEMHQDEPRKIVATFDYPDADGSVIYQTVRLEWTERGNRKKTFLQRRAVDGHPGEWAWGLKAGEYVRAKNGDWYFVTDERASWPGERVTMDEIAHGLYRFEQLREEMMQDPDDRRTIIIPEGEAKVEVHAAWGNVATCSSGGARHWLPHHAQEFVGADVVIEADNDKAGREGAEKKAVSLRGLASRIRVLHWGECWPACPPKGDVKDFKKAGHGSADYWKIVDALRDWTPAMPESRHGAVRFSDLDRPGRRRLQWLVKGLITRGDVSVWYGHPGCGKSYLITDAAFAINRGISWMGRRTRRGLVIYQAGEGGVGFEDRMRAYRMEHGAASVDESSFIMWPERINLHDGDASVDAMIEEARAWSAFYDLPLELLIVDTISAATTGAEENATKDMSVVIDRAWKFARATGAHVAMIHHMPKGGSGPRGSGVLTGNVNTLIEVVKTEETHRSVDGSVVRVRPLRKLIVRKQKDGIDDASHGFILKLVTIGKDEDGDDVTQCVVQPVDDQAALARDEVPIGWAILGATNEWLMRGLVKAIDKCGRYPPADQKVDMPEMTKAVTVGDWIAELAEIKFAADPGDPPTDKYPHGAKLYARCKKAVERTYGEKDWAGKLHLIGKDRQWIWRTTRKVARIDAVPAPVASRPDPQMALAPGETDESLRRTMELG